MKISEKNYFDHIQAIGFENLPEELKQAHLMIMRKTDIGKDWSICEKDPEIKKAVDLAFEKLEELSWYRSEKSLSGNEEDGDNQEIKRAKADIKNYWMFELDMLERLLRMEEDAENEYGSQPEIKIRKRALRKEIKSRKAMSGTTVTEEGGFEEERGFLIRFLALNNKLQTPPEVSSFIDDLQEAINEKRIRKSSPFGSEIALIQDGLLTQYNQMTEEPVLFRLKDTTVYRMNKALDSMPMEKPSKKEGLTGRSLDAPVQEPKPEESKIMCSTDFTQLNFNTLGFKDKWLAFIGDPVPGFTAMVFGRPKMGKSYLCVDFAGYLARNHGKVLYVSKEEKLDATLQKKLMDKDVDHVNLFVADNLPEDLTPYDFIILDSVNKLGLTPKDLEKLKNENKSKCFVFIFQTTKQGIFRGANSFQHDVDVVIEVPEHGKAVQYGRFNQGGELEIFSDEQPIEEVSHQGDNQTALEGVHNSNASRTRSILMVADTTDAPTQKVLKIIWEKANNSKRKAILKQGGHSEKYSKSSFEELAPAIQQIIVKTKFELKFHEWEDRDPEWTEPQGFPKKDWKDLKTFYEYYKAGNFLEAIRFGSNLDTMIREMIPDKIYKALGCSRPFFD